jgi:hypothetical protein
MSDFEAVEVKWMLSRWFSISEHGVNAQSVAPARAPFRVTRHQGKGTANDTEV